MEDYKLRDLRASHTLGRSWNWNTLKIRKQCSSSQKKEKEKKVNLRPGCLMLGLVSIKVFEDYAAACRRRTIPKCQMIQRKCERESGRAFGIKQQRSNHSSEVIPKFQNEEPQIPRASFGQTTTCRSGMQPSLSIRWEASMSRTSIPLRRWVDVRSHASLWWCTGTCFVVTEIKHSCRLK